jgi:hypothetical protein
MSPAKQSDGAAIHFIDDEKDNDGNELGQLFHRLGRGVAG